MECQKMLHYSQGLGQCCAALLNDFLKKSCRQIPKHDPSCSAPLDYGCKASQETLLWSSIFKGRATQKSRVGRYATAGRLHLIPCKARSVLLGPLGFGNVFLSPLLLLLLAVPGLDHLGELPRQQGAGYKEGCQAEDDRGEEAVRVFGSPLDHIFRPGSKINHRYRRGILRTSHNPMEKRSDVVLFTNNMAEKT